MKDPEAVKAKQRRREEIERQAEATAGRTGEAPLKVYTCNTDLEVCITLCVCVCECMEWSAYISWTIIGHREYVGVCVSCRQYTLAIKLYIVNACR